MWFKRADTGKIIKQLENHQPAKLQYLTVSCISNSTALGSHFTQFFASFTPKNQSKRLKKFIFILILSRGFQKYALITCAIISEKDRTDRQTLQNHYIGSNFTESFLLVLILENLCQNVLSTLAQA